MVKENYLNLLREFNKLKGFKLAIFATYSFDNIFFENVLMRELKRNNPEIMIIVLVDSQHYPKSSDFTESTGVEYLLLPFPNTIFHPKVFLFLSEKRGLAYIGSHNLTLSGITHNLELTFRTEDRLLIHEIINFFILLFYQILEPDDPLIKTLMNFKSMWKTRLRKHQKIHLIHNIDGSILKKVINHLRSDIHHFSNVLVFAPFYSNARELLKQIHTDLKVKKIDVCIQRNNHNLDVNNVCDLSFISLKEIIPKEKRRIHSKFILFFGKKNFALIGSPNFTEPALNQEARRGNCELALLIQLEKQQSIFQDLSFKDITISEAQAMIRRELTSTFEAWEEYDVRILMARIDDFGRLLLILDSKTEKKVLNLIVEQPQGKTKIPFTIEKNMRYKRVETDLESSIKPGTEVTLWFEDNGKVVSNIIRAYNPSNPFMLDISGSEIEPHKIPSLVSDVKDLEDLLRIIAALFPEERCTRIPSKPGKVEPSPGRVKGIGSSENLLEMLLKILRVPRIRKRRIPGKRGSGESHLRPDGEKREIQKSRIIDKLANAFGARRLSVNNSIVNYSVFLLISMKIIEIFGSEDQERIKLLSRVIKYLSMLLDSYGVSVKNKEDLLLFISILIYIKSEIVGLKRRPIIEYEIDNRIVKKIIQEMEVFFFSKGNLWEGLRFKDEIFQKLNELKIIPEYEANVNKIISSLVAMVILTKNQQIQLDISKRIIKEIAEVPSDPQALFLSNIARELTLHNLMLRSVIKMEINRMRDKELKYFRRILYEDIIKNMKERS